MSLPVLSLKVHPLGANINVGKPNLKPALAPASSIPVWPPLLIEFILVFNLGEFITLCNILYT